MNTSPPKNKVTFDDILSKVVSETYTVLPNGRTTVCQLTLINGFTVEGYSACVDIANYNEVLGNKIAKDNALDNVWVLEGYLLSESLFRMRQLVASA